MPEASPATRAQVQTAGVTQKHANQGPAFELKQNWYITQKVISFINLGRTTMDILQISENDFN